MLIVTDRNLQTLTIVSNDYPDGVHFQDDKFNENLETGTCMLTCSIDKVVEKDVELIEAGCLIVATGYKKKPVLLEITEVVETRYSKEIVAEDCGLDLLNEDIGEQDFKGTLAEWVNNTLGEKSDWVVGINEAKDKNLAFKFDGTTTKTKRLAMIAGRFGCEISYDVKLNGNAIDKKVINFYKKRGKETGYRLEFGRDVRELPYGSFSTKYSANINIASTTQSVSLGSGYKEFASYEVRVTATDKFRSYTALVTVPTQSIGIAINPKNNSVGIGKFPDDKLVGNDNLEVKGDIFAQGIEADLTLKAWKADINYLNIKDELKIDDKPLDIKPFAEYNSSSRLDTESTRDLFGTADLGPVSYEGSIGGFAYSDVIRVNFPYYVNSISYLNMCMVGTSDTGIFPFIISYDSSGFRLRVLNIVNSNTTNRVEISYHVRGER